MGLPMSHVLIGPLLCNTLKVGFRQFDRKSITSGFRRVGMVRGSKRDQEMSPSALHNRPTSLGRSGQIASDTA